MGVRPRAYSIIHCTALDPYIPDILNVSRVDCDLTLLHCKKAKNILVLKNWSRKLIYCVVGATRAICLYNSGELGP